MDNNSKLLRGQYKFPIPKILQKEIEQFKRDEFK